MALRVALLGAGYWGKKILYELMELEAERAIDISGVADINPERLIKIPNLKTTLAHETLIEHSDAAVIATPSETHYEVARRWIDEGKHILIEKPITTTCDEAKDLLARIADNDVFAMPGHIYRFNRQTRLIQNVIKNNELGDVLASHFEWSSPTLQRDLLLDLLPHVLDLMDMFFEYGPVKVLDGTQYDGFLHQEDHAIIHYQLLGSLSRVILSRGEPEKRRIIKILGQEKWLFADVLYDPQFIHFVDPITGTQEDRWVVPTNPLKEEIRAFVRGVEYKYPNILLERAVAAMEVLDMTRGDIKYSS